MELDINLKLTRRLCSGFLEDEVHKVGLKKGVIGLSGGVDSALVAYLAADALGAENVIGIMMPYRQSHPESLAHARMVVERLGIEGMAIEITPMVDAYYAHHPDEDPVRRGNKMARERMTILYDYSARMGALVLGTSNKTELLLGYGTLFGDMASAVNPIGDLYKTQVWALSEHLGVPKEIITKNPSADLWDGQTDEQELGFSYHEVDRLLYALVDLRLPPGDMPERGFDTRLVERVVEMVRGSQYKRRPPIIAKVSGRSIGHDFRYPRDWGM